MQIESENKKMCEWASTLYLVVVVWEEEIIQGEKGRESESARWDQAII